MPALTSRVTLRANTTLDHQPGASSDQTHDTESHAQTASAEKQEDEEEEEEEGPEDVLFSSLATIFPDDAPNLHGDSHSSIVYTSPHLPSSLTLRLADPEGDEDRKLFSHYLWNAGLMLAELLESASLGLNGDEDDDEKRREGLFDVRGLKVLEMGSGTGLPSIMAGLVGAEGVVATDYPSKTVLEPLGCNMKRNMSSQHAPKGAKIATSIEVHGHAWGDFAAPPPPSTFPVSHRHSLDRVLLADCLWMPWQHAPLLHSVSYFLSRSPSARCLCVGACHTGREVVARFFEGERLRDLGLEVEEIWERDVEGRERAWEAGRADEDGGKKRWCIVAVLRRIEGWNGEVSSITASEGS